MLHNSLKRKIIVTGHYGSGKTEFSVSLAMQIASEREPLSLIDLDIVNPYFRSRERRELLGRRGIKVYGSVYQSDVTAEIPELGATVRAPLEDENTRVIVDLGGNDSGALVINQFAKYFTTGNGDDTSIIAVVNANRPGTYDIDGAVAHIKAIEKATALTVTHIANNTHLTRETTAGDIKKGHALCSELCRITGKAFLCDCYPEGIVDPAELTELKESLFPMGLYMRQSWM